LHRIKLQADIDTEDISIFNDSPVFSIKGSASAINDATELTIGVDITATATINKRGKLVVTTSVKGSSTKGYELQLSGEYTNDKTSISFSASCASTGGVQTMKGQIHCKIATRGHERTTFSV
jgi:hypothetical protein